MWHLRNDFHAQEVVTLKPTVSDNYFFSYSLITRHFTHPIGDSAYYYCMVRILIQFIL